MNKRRRFKAKRNRRENKIIKDFQNKMRGLRHKDYYTIKIEIK